MASSCIAAILLELATNIRPRGVGSNLPYYQDSLILCYSDLGKDHY